MSILKKLAGDAAVYGLSSVLGRVLNYLLVPLYTSVFLPAEYGIVTELYAYVAFLNILYVYGLETAYFRFSSKVDKQYFNVAFTSILLSSITLSGLLGIFSQTIADILHYPDQAHLIQWLAAILAIDAVVAIPFARLREEGQAKKFAIFKLTNIGLNIFFNIFFILLCPKLLDQYPSSIVSSIYDERIGVGYVFLSNLLANGFYLILFFPMLKKVRLKLDMQIWKPMIKYGWPLLIIGFAGVTNEMLSRALLKYRLPQGYYEGFTNLEILGIFGACYKLSVFMTLAVQAFRYAFEPFLFAQAGEGNSPKIFSRVMTYFVLFTSFSWLVLVLFMPYYAPIFLRQTNYLMALDAVPWLLGGGLLLGVFYNLSIWYKLTDNTLYGAYVSITGAFLTLILNWWLIPLFGYMGSAYATFATYLMMVVISYTWGRQIYKVPYQVIRVILYFLLAGVGIYINEVLEGSFVISLLITLIFLTLAFLLERKNLNLNNS